MVQIVGKYQYVSSENFEDYIKNLGKGELVDTFLQTTPIVEIQQNGDQWVVVVTINQDKTITTTFKLGEIYDEHLPTPGLTFKSVTTKESNGFRTETTLSAGIKAIRNYEFTDTEMIVHLSSNESDVQAKRIYKRL
ncbi:PREDICTED: fatty acid-binding protein homolog 5-like [Trachymyrmex cornetzi]|uniref:Fatty acid-binding protein like protein 5 n=1 Tax=Trachymyrmex cornetzi TaxID=471704 RepID=A0A195DMS1_9HYME|nr:PREDICTED: fatty acid-binding protein homolog 5-like [Trachymyrmex cornetzi]KYN14127.1 Fatty acid-binding protein like protein 5 [Trachymyrmex cornetzi]